MAIRTTFYDWPSSGLDPTRPEWNSCSPNLTQIRAFLDAEFGRGDFLGCHADRPIRAGTKPSEHSWGASFDWRYPRGKGPEIMRFLIDYSEELGVVGIHDYLGCRIWHAGRTSRVQDAHGSWWKAQTPNPANGMGQSWADYLHITTSRDKYHDSTPVRDRLERESEIPKVIDYTLVGGGSRLLLPDKSPARLADTRIGLNAQKGRKIEQNHPLTVAIPGSGSGGGTVRAAIVNVTLVEPEGDGYARVYGLEPGDGSNINVTHGQSAEPSPTIVAVGPERTVTVQLTRVKAHVLVDLLGLVVD